MAIRASLSNFNLFSSLPSTPPPNEPTSFSPPSPPIPIPKYPPPCKKPKKPHTTNANPALKIPHNRTKYYKPVKEGVISSDGDRSVIIGDSGVSYLLPGAPFEFQFSYSETPKVKPLAIREPAFLPFAPPTMPRPWTGKAPLKKSTKKIPLFDSPEGVNGVNQVEMPHPFPLKKLPHDGRTREEILGEPLKKWEIRTLIKPLSSDNRQVNLGRDGLTHNMLELIHSHWKRSPVCKVRCKGVPTVDMNNVCRCLEERTRGKVIHRVGGVVYLFRGRNYDYRTRPQYPVMLWKPAAPVYPKLIQEAPEGLTKAEANELREKGKKLLPICKLAKNGVYISLARDVRIAFEGSPLVKIDCKGIDASDYKKLGAKLKDLVPCVLLSFDEEQILMWRGQNWKPKYPNVPSISIPDETAITSCSNDSRKSGDYCNKADANVPRSSPKMMFLWESAIESSKAILLDEIDLGPDDLLRKVEEFENISNAIEHSYPALVLSGGAGSISEHFGENDKYSDAEHENDVSFEEYISVPLGSLPVDLMAEQLNQE